MKYEISNQERLEMRRKEERHNNQNRLNELQLRYLQEQLYMRDNIIDKARKLLQANQIKFIVDEEYNQEAVYDMLENAETSFP